MLGCRNRFVFAAGVVLLITGFAKLWSAFSGVKLLDVADPLLGLPFRFLMLAAGVLEVAVAAACFFSSRPEFTASLVVWLATSFGIYRLGLWWMDWNRPCPCLGNFADALHLSPAVTDGVLKAALAYLLVVGYASLYSLKCKGRGVSPEGVEL